MLPFEKEQLQAAGITGFGVIDPREIVFGQEIRDICANNGCGQYGKTWCCPPHQGTLEECRARCLSYSHALVFQTVYPIEDSFDYEGMVEAGRDFKQVTERLYALAKPVLPKFLLLSNEGCGRCEKCTCPDAPCRFPEKLFPAVEGYGIYVNKLAESAGLKYINGKNTVTYFGMLLY